jgi:hypothetical protein
MMPLDPLVADAYRLLAGGAGVAVGDPVLGHHAAALRGVGKGYLRRREALEVLTRLGPRAGVAVPALEKLASGEDYFLCEGSRAALRAIREAS